MTTENKVLQQLRALNPITDERTIDLPDTSSTAFLEALETRRGIMSVTTERPIEKSPKERKRRRNIALALGAAVIVAAIGVSALLVTDDGPDAGDQGTVVEEFIDRRSSGQRVASLELATAEFANSERDYQAGFEAWNARAELVEPCEELPPKAFRCVLLETNDFFAAGGLGPWETRITISFNEANQISDLSFDVVDWDKYNSPFHNRFLSWLRDAHPEEAAGLGVTLLNDLNAENARIALQYVDEFVAQSDDYPINP